MPNVLPQSQAPKSGGILFVNEPGVANFRALRVDVGNQHLYWQPTYQHLLRVEGAFGEFFPQAEFSDNGNRVVFTKHIEGVEVLGKTRALRPGERIPRREWLRFLTTWQSFKRLSERTDIPDDFRNFIIQFGPPSVERYPAAYRIYRPHWYSRPRLFILWGLEPVGGADFISLSPDQAISEVGARVESDRDEANGQLLLWLKAFGLFVLTCLALLLVTWVCLPRPVVDFELKAQATVPAHPTNLSGFDQDWVWGQTAYAWTFDRGQPDTSNEKEPQVLWSQPGLRDATLQVTQSTLWGLLYKTEAKSKSILVQDAPKPPPVIVVITPGHGQGSVDKPGEGVTPAPVVIDGHGLPGGTTGERIPSDPSHPGNPWGPLTVITPVKPTGPNMEQEGKPLPGGLSSEADGKPMPGTPFDPLKKKEGEEALPGKNPTGTEGKPMPADPLKKADGEEPITGGEPKTGPMKGETSPPGRNEGQLEVIPGKNPAGTEGKPMPVEPSQEGRANEKMTPNGGKPDENTPDKAESAPGGRMATPGEKDPKAGAQRHAESRKLTNKQDSQPRVLNQPELSVTKETVVDGTDSQDIEFSVQMGAGTKIDRVTIDGIPVEVFPSGFFKKRLSTGTHEIHVEYRSSDSSVHEGITKTLSVDSDKVVTPKNQLSPAKKDSSKSTNTPSDPEPQPKQESPEKIDKKLA